MLRYILLHMYATFSIQNFETVIRKSTYGFIQRLLKAQILLLWLLKSHGLCVLIFGTCGKRHCTSFQQHEV